MARSIEHRIEKLEEQAGVGESQPVIRYNYNRKDGDAAAEAAKEKALAEWEAMNGPLGDREPLYIERSIVGAWIVLPPRRMPEAESPEVASDPAPGPPTSFLAR